MANQIPPADQWMARNEPMTLRQEGKLSFEANRTGTYISFLHDPMQHRVLSKREASDLIRMLVNNDIPTPQYLATLGTDTSNPLEWPNANLPATGGQRRCVADMFGIPLGNLVPDLTLGEATVWIRYGRARGQ